MTLIYLGLVNSLRNLGRSLLTVITMALAAVMMTGSLTLGEGYTSFRAVEYRAFLGGDVLIYPAWAWPTEADMATIQPGQVRLATLPPHFGSPLMYFHPDYYAGGYLTSDPLRAPGFSMFGTATQMDQAVARFKAFPGVAGVTPFEALPVTGGNLEVLVGTDTATKASRVPLGGFFLRACPPNLLAGPDDPTPPELRLAAGQQNPPAMVTVNTSAGETLSDVKTWTSGVLLTDGRALQASDGDSLVALVNRRAVIPRNLLATETIAPGAPGAGQTIEITVPRIVGGDEAAGRPPYYDFADPVTIELRVVGTYDVASRLYHWIISKGLDAYEQLYTESPELLVRPEAFQRILETAGLKPGDPPPVGALLLNLEDQGKAEETAAALRQAVPGFSVVTVAREAAYANLRLLPETIYEAPPKFRPAPLPPGQPAVPAEAGNFFGALVFGFAGLVAAGNATLLVLSRRTEFAILKAIGMRGFEIAMVVLVETITLSALGLVIGFAAGELGALPIILTNNVGFAAVMRALGHDFGVVAAAALGCAVLFSLAPMSKTLRITVAEAMRGNE